MVFIKLPAIVYSCLFLTQFDNQSQVTIRKMHSLTIETHISIELGTIGEKQQKNSIATTIIKLIFHFIE